MAKPLARVLMLLDILQAGGTRTLRELAERLGVDERTVRRYVDHLLDLGVPVESVRGRYGGYRLAPGYRMPPLMLTDDEATALGARGAAGDAAAGGSEGVDEGARADHDVGEVPRPRGRSQQCCLEQV